MYLNIDVDIPSVRDALLADMSYEALFQFIVELDEQTADWDFTKRLHKHFKHSMRQYKLEKDKTMVVCKHKFKEWLIDTNGEHCRVCMLCGFIDDSQRTPEYQI